MIDETRYEEALQKSGGYLILETEPGVFTAEAQGLNKSATGGTKLEARDRLFDAIFEVEGKEGENNEVPYG